MKRSGQTVWELRKLVVDAMYFSHKGNGTSRIIIKTCVIQSRLFRICYYFQGI